MRLDIFNPDKGAKKDDWHAKAKLLDMPMMVEQKQVLESWTEGFEDRDGKIIREFQKTFHSSFWEFFLYALFKDLGFEVDMSHHAPDFIITDPCRMNIEAVVANVREKGRQEDSRGMNDLLSMFTPPYAQPDFYDVLDESIFRMSKAVTDKHKKYLRNYSKHEWISEDNPFVIAACSFDQVNYGREYIYSMMALLYGLYYDAESATYTLKDSIKKPGAQLDIPLGLFLDEKYSDISAIIYSSTVTIGKLTAMHISQGGESENVVLQLWEDPDNLQMPYALQYINPYMPELLSEGVFVFHNPMAKNPIPAEVFFQKAITQYGVQDDEVVQLALGGQLISRLDVSKWQAHDMKPYITQQLFLYNRLNPYKVYDPKHKQVNFQSEKSVFILIKTPEGGAADFGINYEVPKSISDEELKKDAQKRFERTCQDSRRTDDTIKEILIAETQQEFDKITSNYSNITDLSIFSGQGQESKYHYDLLPISEEKEIICEALDVCFVPTGEAIIIVQGENEQLLKFRLPKELHPWVGHVLQLQLKAVDLFPAMINFGIHQGRHYAGIK